ncbi:Hypothetical predicted protein [Paramuricea clavata]|uniref:Uncharacterized protein n=1 Tax=Paramuricea clavata TaxID=317549 RepID=A0A6S7G4B0_PARCT|nr:Hypothetical predicted protein [Paramuricea clavata]
MTLLNGNRVKTQPAKKLLIDTLTKPASVLPNNNGEFKNFTFGIPQLQQDITTEIFADENQQENQNNKQTELNVDNFTPSELQNITAEIFGNEGITLEELNSSADMIGNIEFDTSLLQSDFDDNNNLATTQQPQQHRGKDVSMAKKIHDEEEKTNKRKRAEVQPRLSGRPTIRETLMKIDGEDDLEVLQLREAKLILVGTITDTFRKSKTVFTKCKGGDIIVNTQKQFLTYELFGDLRKKSLDIIKEQREILLKINAAEATMHNLMKKPM